MKYLILLIPILLISCKISPSIRQVYYNITDNFRHPATIPMYRLMDITEIEMDSIRLSMRIQYGTANMDSLCTASMDSIKIGTKRLSDKMVKHMTEE